MNGRKTIVNFSSFILNDSIMDQLSDDLAGWSTAMFECATIEELYWNTLNIGHMNHLWAYKSPL